MKAKKQRTVTKQACIRKSISGLPLLSWWKSHRLTIETKCPAKWVFIDIEDDYCWAKADEDENWHTPSEQHLRDARLVLTRAIRHITNKRKAYAST